MSIVNAAGQMMRGAPAAAGVMYGGGGFTTAGGGTISLGGAFASPLLPDASELDLFPWNPDCNGSVRAMVLNGADMYLGGAFTLVGGQERIRAACVDSDPTQPNPTLRDWNPDCNNGVNTMILDGDDMYLGGSFTLVGGQERIRAACVDSDPAQADPALREWNPNCGGSVLTMLLDGEHMYLGGAFTTVGVETRNRAACVDSDPAATNPTVRPWHPNCSSTVWTMLLTGADMYLGGVFTLVGGETRNNAACVDSEPNSAATLRDWNPNCGGTVQTMLLRGSDMYLGGLFTTVSLADRLRIAAVDSDPATNFLLDYNLVLNDNVRVLISS